jgi:tRNA threonylcarbamoyladenosine biosynthesis protein TsaE
MRLILPSPTDTNAIGAALAASRPARAVLYLHGDLGAGKSTLARAMLRALGVQGAIRSPTYTLIERYALAAGKGEEMDEAVHLDLYRIAATAELEFLGLDDLAAQAALWLIEWPERGGSALPPADLHVRMALQGEGRAAVLEPASATGVLWLDNLATDPRVTGRSDAFVQIPGAPS